jgi:hypothetical protein
MWTKTGKRIEASSSITAKDKSDEGIAKFGIILLIFIIIRLLTIIKR